VASGATPLEAVGPALEQTEKGTFLRCSTWSLDWVAHRAAQDAPQSVPTYPTVAVTAEPRPPPDLQAVWPKAAQRPDCIVPFLHRHFHSIQPEAE
jgi:hypothetical protein